MNDASLLFSNAEAALAAYSALQSGRTDNDANKLALVAASGAGMALTQATEFATRYPTIITQFNDTPAEGGMGTSFSATVFKDSTGKLTLAIRGTLELTGTPNDLISTDADIAFAGAGYDQIVAMANWWAKASAPAGQMVNQFRLAEMPLSQIPADAVVIRAGSAPETAYVLDAAPQTRAAGTVRDALLADPDLRVEVTGHSLGGHLAMAFSTLFAAQTGQVTIFNAPGFANSTVNQNFFAKLGGAIPTSASIVNVIADEALVGDSPYNFVAGMHSRPGVQINIAIEKQTNSDEPAPPGSRNHSIVVLTDSLAVYKLLADLAPAFGANAFTATDYKRILNQAVQGTAAGYERIVDALEKLFTGDRELLATGNGKREDLYKAIQGLTKPNSTYASKVGQLQIEAVTGSADTFVSNAQTGDQRGLAWRYALKELDPFVVIDANSTGLYWRFQTGGPNAGELDLYNPAGRTGTLTVQWLEDRAALLQRRLDIAARDEINDIDNPLNLNNTTKTWEADPFYFEDRATDYVLNQGGQRVHDPYIIFGSDGADVISGSSRADRLYGGGGTDYLQGKADADSLEGGAGLDIYEYNTSTGSLGQTNDGADIIHDIDGRGVLRYIYSSLSGDLQSTVIAEASDKRSETEWRSADGKYIYIKSGADLVITINGDAGGTFTLKDFRNGDFGIHLWEARPTPQTTNTINAVNYPDNKTIYDMAGNDLILGDARDNYVNASFGGDDWIQAGAGRDFIFAGSTNPAEVKLIEGGAGDDVLTGGPGNDELYANLRVDLAQAIVAGNGAGNGVHGDWLSGGWGDDVLVGDASNDGFSAGMGRDVVVAGAGDDNIFGDADWVATTLDWYYVDDTTANTRLFYWFNGSDNYDVGDADIIYTGSGDDYVWAGGGDDMVWGELGRDQIVGQSGSDVLIGGEDDDRLWGDDGRLAIEQTGDDYLDGGAGNDFLNGEAGNDVLIGGAGNDTLIGGTGKDIYVFNRGDGVDTVFDTDADSNSPDASVLVLGDDVNGSNIIFRVGSLAVDIGNGDVIHFSGFDQFNPTASTPLGEIRLADGTSMSYADILAQGFDIDGTEGNDNSQPGEPPNLVGTGVTDRIRGFGGNDLLFGLTGNDMLDGGAGADSILGGGGADIAGGGDSDDVIWGDADQFAPLDEGDDVLSGDAGNDHLIGGGGGDVLDGGADNDVLWGDAGNDTLDGGAGNDYLIGGMGDDVLAGGDGNDVYFYGLGDGIDHISDSGGADWLVFQNGITLQGVRLGVGSLRLTLSDGGEVHLDDFDPDNPLAGAIEYIQFSDGVAMTREQLIQTLGFEVEGTPGDDVLSGTAYGEPIHAYAGDDSVDARGGDDHVFGEDGNDSLSGGSGNDLLDGGSGNDILHGDAGADRLLGGAGDDVLAGGAGNDTLEGGDDNDVYLFGAGDGQDIAIDASGSDAVQLTGGLSGSQITMRRVGSDLVIDINGTADRLTVRDWFGAAGNFGTLTLGDGSVLDRAGVEARLVTNQAPLATQDAASVQEDVLLGASGNALANDIDPEGRALRITNPGTYSGAYGTLTLAADGAYGYTLINASAAVQSLAAGQTVTEHFGYTVTDDDPAAAATASSVITINISGTNDAPVVSPDTATVIEDGVLVAGGNVLANDADIDAGTALRVTAPGTITSTYGTLTLAAEGAYSYALDNAAPVVQSLGRTRQISERFHYTVSDGVTGVDTVLEVNVHGANDAPVVAAPLADQIAEINSAWSWQLPEGSFADIDHGDVLAYRAALADGAPLPSWLSFDGTNQTFSGRVPRDAGGYLDISVIATDSAPGAAAESNLSVAEEFRLSFTDTRGGGGGGGQGNAGVGDGADAPPPGQDYNFNDGAGTFPGSPGAQGGYGYQPQLPAMPDAVMMRLDTPEHMPPQAATTVASVRPGVPRAAGNPVLPDVGSASDVAAVPGQLHANQDMGGVRLLSRADGLRAGATGQPAASMEDWSVATRHPAAADLSWLDEIMRAEDVTGKSAGGRQASPGWQRMHQRLDMHLAGIADLTGGDGFDPAALKPVHPGVRFTQFGAAGWGAVGLRDGGAVELRSFSGLREGLASIS